MVRVKQTFPVEVEDVNVVSVDDLLINNQNKCSFPCDQPACSTYAIGSKKQAEFIEDILGTRFSVGWKAPIEIYHFCHPHTKQFRAAKQQFRAQNETTERSEEPEIHWLTLDRAVTPAVRKRRLEPELPVVRSLAVPKKAPQVAVKRKDSSSTPLPQSCCDVCGWKEGIFETIESLSYARHIDRILGSRISENWKGSVKICLCHILECGKEKNHIPWYLQRPRRVHCTLCFETFISPPNDTAPPGSHSVYCPVCVKKLRQRKCSICGELIDLFQCVQVNDIMMKAKLNAFFRTNMELDEQTEHMCSHHWNQWFDQHIKVELAVDSNSSERHDSGVLPNKQETEEERKEEFGGSVEMGHQSIDMKETTNNQLVKDEVINVEELIGQGQKIPQQDYHKSNVPPIDSDELQQCTVAGDVLIDSDYRSNSEILVKEEIKGELE